MLPVKQCQPYTPRYPHFIDAGPGSMNVNLTLNWKEKSRADCMANPSEYVETNNIPPVLVYRLGATLFSCPSPVTEDGLLLQQRHSLTGLQQWHSLAALQQWRALALSLSLSLGLAAVLPTWILTDELSMQQTMLTQRRAPFFKSCRYNYTVDITHQHSLAWLDSHVHETATADSAPVRTSCLVVSRIDIRVG